MVDGSAAGTRLEWDRAINLPAAAARRVLRVFMEMGAIGLGMAFCALVIN